MGSFERRTSRHDHVLTHPVGHNLFAFKRHTRIARAKQSLDEATTQGFATKGALDSFRHGRSAELATLNQTFLVDETFTEMMRVHGWPSYRDEWTYDAFNAALSKTPYDDLVAGASPDRVVRIDISDHLMYDREDRRLPVGIRYGVGNHVDTLHYDLKKAVVLLQANPAIKLEKETMYRDSYVHNGYEGSPDYLSFVWAPTQEEYDRLWAYVNRMKGHTSADLRKAEFDLDMLGLRKGEAAYFDDYYKSKETEELDV